MRSEPFLRANNDVCWMGWVFSSIWDLCLLREIVLLQRPLEPTHFLVAVKLCYDCKKVCTESMISALVEATLSSLA